MEAVRNRYPCVICNETFLKDSYESHIAECVTSVSDRMSSLLREKLSINRHFAQCGEERYKLHHLLPMEFYRDQGYSLLLLWWVRNTSGFMLCYPIFTIFLLRWNKNKGYP